ncbi:MAG: hypothetical protein M1828_002439 [Chrysothrix sp. TS-e1954]|nr:MAG: hypothetical protein M1828_002439 [Chrysothrix sp. TS-e1954]
MVDSTLVVALIALLVSLIAMIIALGQLAAQLLGTADGYRRCSRSVMGGWAGMTRRKWHWREFRFETFYTTPSFSLWSSSGLDMSRQLFRSRGLLVLGAGDAHNDARIKDRARYDHSRDLSRASWLLLLDHIHTREMTYWGLVFPREYHEHPQLLDPAGLGGEPHANIPHRTVVCITNRVRSWDFMPPDVVRPMGHVSLGDLISIGHRLGMAWRDIRPGDSILRAEGSGASISSAQVRGVGLLIDFRYDPASDDTRWKLLPTYEADMMGFGLVRADKPLFAARPSTQDFSTSDTIKAALKYYEVTEAALKVYTETTDLATVGEIIGLLSPWMAVESADRTKLIRPTPARADIASPFTWREGRLLFHHVLTTNREAHARSEASNYVAEVLEDLARDFPARFTGNSQASDETHGEVEFIRRLRKCHARTTAYFARFADPAAIIGCHISANIESSRRAAENVTEKKPHPGDFIPEGRYSPTMLERAYIYMDNRKSFVELVASENTEPLFEKSEDIEADIEGAWWMLVLRGIVWFLSVDFVEPRAFPNVPSVFWGSTTPVYIG